MAERFLAGHCAPCLPFLLTDLPLPPFVSAQHPQPDLEPSAATTRLGGTPTASRPPNRGEGERTALPFRSLLKTEPRGGNKKPPKPSFLQKGHGQMRARVPQPPAAHSPPPARRSNRLGARGLLCLDGLQRQMGQAAALRNADSK